MGMDGLDIAFRLEKRFEISIDSDEAIYVYLTPARIEWLVLEKLAGRQPAVVDLSAVMDRIVGIVTGIRDRRIHWFQPSSLEREFPAAKRKDSWRAFSVALGVDLPGLEFPDSPQPRIPRYVSSVFGLAVWLVDHYPQSCPLSREGTPVAPLGTGLWQNAEVSAAIIEVLRDALGVEEDEITPDCLMVDDLGME